MSNLVAEHPELKECLDALKHLFVDIARLKHEPTYGERAGGYGEVQVATLDPETPHASKLVAVKKLLLRPQQNDPLRLAFRLARELKVWAGLCHPHVLPLLGFYLDDDYKTAALISEFMEYGDLKYYITTKSPTYSERLNLIRDLTDGLAYLHARACPVRHGDLKPGNVLVNPERRALLADFGLSKALDAGPTGFTTGTDLKCTVRYSGPEVLLGGPDEQSLVNDIWSWACLVFEVITDKVPFSEVQSEIQLIVAHVQGQSPCEEDFLALQLPQFNDLLWKCWDQEPNQRPKAADCLSIIQSALSDFGPAASRTWRKAEQPERLKHLADVDDNPNPSHQELPSQETLASPGVPSNKPNLPSYLTLCYQVHPGEKSQPVQLQEVLSKTSDNCQTDRPCAEIQAGQPPPQPQTPTQDDELEPNTYLERIDDLPLEAIHDRLVSLKSKIKALEDERDRVIQVKTLETLEQALKLQVQVGDLKSVKEELIVVYTRRQAAAPGLEQPAATLLEQSDARPLAMESPTAANLKSAQKRPEMDPQVPQDGLSRATRRSPDSYSAGVALPVAKRRRLEGNRGMPRGRGGTQRPERNRAQQHPHPITSPPLRGSAFGSEETFTPLHRRAAEPPQQQALQPDPFGDGVRPYMEQDSLDQQAAATATEARRHYQQDGAGRISELLELLRGPPLTGAIRHAHSPLASPAPYMSMSDQLLASLRGMEPNNDIFGGGPNAQQQLLPLAFGHSNSAGGNRSGAGGPLRAPLNQSQNQDQNSLPQIATHRLRDTTPRQLAHVAAREREQTPPAFENVQQHQASTRAQPGPQQQQQQQQYQPLQQSCAPPSVASTQPGQPSKQMQFHEFFTKTFNDWLAQRQLTLDPPRVDGKEVALYKLFLMVGALGGCRPVFEKKLWSIVAAKIGFPYFTGPPPYSKPDVAEQVSKIYQKMLADFEVHWHNSLRPGDPNSTFPLPPQLQYLRPEVERLATAQFPLQQPQKPLRRGRSLGAKPPTRPRGPTPNEISQQMPQAGNTQAQQQAIMRNQQDAPFQFHLSPSRQGGSMVAAGLANLPPTLEQHPPTVSLLPGLNVPREQLAKAREKVRATFRLVHNQRDYSPINLPDEQGTLLERSIRQTQGMLKQVAQNLVPFVVLTPGDGPELNQIAETVVTIADQAQILQQHPSEKRFIFGLSDLNTYRSNLMAFLARAKSLQSQAIALQNQQSSISSKRGPSKRPGEGERPPSGRERGDVADPNAPAGPSNLSKRRRANSREDSDSQRHADIVTAKQLTTKGRLQSRGD